MVARYCVQHDLINEKPSPLQRDVLRTTMNFGLNNSCNDPSNQHLIEHLRYMTSRKYRPVLDIANITRNICKDIQFYHIEAETKWPSFCGQHFQMFFLTEKVLNSLKISLELLPRGSINNISAFRPGDKPLSEPMMVSLLTCMRHSASVS